ncbi:MAG: exonuclease SbcCD subunit D [Lachnospiraceae bacterium]|nr:exonuclease SbcCD subunit D [Lachnospiraceae bacterium]
MKFLHLGDLHIGKSLGEYDLLEDQEYILKQILDLITEEDVDAVMIAGDIYDRSIPSEGAVNIFDSFLNQLAQKNVETFIITGNHDSDDRMNYGREFFARHRIHICAKYMGELFCYNLEDEKGEVSVYLLPFVKASQVKHYFENEKIENYNDGVRTLLQHANVDGSKRNVLVAHQFVAGKSDPMFSGSESGATINVGTVERIGYDLFDDFDYVALGHIHMPQKVGREEIRYAGSPLKYSASEANGVKSVPIVTLSEKGEVSIQLRELHPLRDMRQIKGTMKQLLSEENIVNPQDFIYVTLTDEDIIPDAMGIFRQHYPNTVKIEYHNSRTREIESVDISHISKNKSFETLISEFYESIYGVEIGDEEMELLKKVAGEAGVTDETN